MADRFPTAEERWPRQGKVMTKRVFIIGNGEDGITKSNPALIPISIRLLEIKVDQYP